MFYLELLNYIYTHIPSNLDLNKYKIKINKFVKSQALLQLFNDGNEYFICLIKDNNCNYYFMLLDKDFNYKCHSIIYDTVYNYIKFSEYIKYNQQQDINIDVLNMEDSIYNCVKSKLNILLLKEEYNGNKILFVKIDSINYLFLINDINKFNQIKILKYNQI
jgi:hypothetical protein